MEPKRILPEFQDFLATRKLVPEGKTRFFAYWVSRFLRFLNRSDSSDIDTVVKAFLGSLKISDDVADWQVKQGNVMGSGLVSCIMAGKPCK